MNLSDIDSFVNQSTQSFKSLVEIFNMKNNIEKDSILTSIDLLKSRQESMKLLKDYSFNFEDFINKAHQEFVSKKIMDDVMLDNIKSIYYDKISAIISENTFLLLKNAEKNGKKSQIRNVSRISNSKVVYSNDYVYDSSQRKISLVDKFRKDLRKALIDYVNDVVVFAGYNNGKTNGYTKTSTGELYKIFSLSDYIRGDVKNSIFHPNVQSLAYIED